MKKCPYCAEEIKSEAIKCKHCHEWLDNKQEEEIQEERESSPRDYVSSDYSDGEDYIEPGWDINEYGQDEYGQDRF